eukprot:12199-Heterococcus_DN1.PRE.1
MPTSLCFMFTIVCSTKHRCERGHRMLILTSLARYSTNVASGMSVYTLPVSKSMKRMPLLLQVLQLSHSLVLPLSSRLALLLPSIEKALSREYTLAVSACAANTVASMKISSRCKHVPQVSCGTVTGWPCAEASAGQLLRCTHAPMAFDCF